MTSINSLKLLSLSLILTLASCSKTEDPLPESEAAHWDYEHTDWTDLGYVDCSGTIQSPVNILSMETIKADLPNVSISYSPFPIKIIDNGHTLQVNNNGVNKISYNGHDYEFKQFHFHAHSEHQLDGKSSEMELHLVHQDPNSKALLVLGFFIEPGSANDLFDKVLKNWPKEKEVEQTGTDSIDLNSIIPKDKKYFTYTGSLTTPPCSQGVSFILFKQHLNFSTEQISAFTAVYDHNARPIQPLNNRLVFEDLN